MLKSIEPVLRPPLKTNIGQSFIGSAESFSQRIIGNYGLMHTQCRAPDLLHLLTTPVELPDDLGGMTTLINQKNNVNMQSIDIDVINNVVNRILLDGSPQFTYQDQVYISTVLNQLGIHNAQQFMDNVRQLRTETESTLHLIQSYQSELKTVMKKQEAGEETVHLPLPPTEEDQKLQNRDPRALLSIEILNRLNVSQINENLLQFQRAAHLASTQFKHEEFLLAEHLHMSNQLQLAELKNQVYQQPSLHLLHHLNQFETNLLMVEPRNEQEVLSQAAAAALVNTVDHAITEVLHRPEIHHDQWVLLNDAIHQTAEMSLARFEKYHTEALVLPQTADSPLLPAENHYLREIRDYQNFYQSLYPRAAEYGRTVGLPPMSKLLMTHLTHMEREERPEASHNFYAQRRAETRQVLQELISSQRIHYYHQSALERDQLTYRDRTLLLQHLQPGSAEEPIPMAPVSPVRNVTQVLENTLRAAQNAAAEPQEPVSMLLAGREDGEPYSDFQGEQPDEIDERNQMVLGSVREELVQPRSTPAPLVPDMKRTMRDALRALENPQELLEEIYAPENQAAVQPQLTQEETMILSHADPATREYYEQILLFQKDPEAALAKGFVKPASLGSLMADLQYVNQGQTPLPGEEPLEGEEEELPPGLNPEIIEEIVKPSEAARSREAAAQSSVIQQQIEHKVTEQVEKRVTKQDLEVLRQIEKIMPARQQQQELELIHRPTEETAQEVQEQIDFDPADIHRIVYEEVSPESTDTFLEEIRQKAGLRTVEEQITKQEKLETLTHMLTSSRQQSLVFTVEHQLGNMKFVHKSNESGLSEELLERLQQTHQLHQLTTEDLTMDQLNRQTTHQVDLHQQENQVVMQTSEDITELVNRTLSKQMRSISNQVYQQMEKRLQTERSRRGRF